MPFKTQLEAASLFDKVAEVMDEMQCLIERTRDLCRELFDNYPTRLAIDVEKYVKDFEAKVQEMLPKKSIQQDKIRKTRDSDTVLMAKNVDIADMSRRYVLTCLKLSDGSFETILTAPEPLEQTQVIDGLSMIEELHFDAELVAMNNEE